MALSQSALSELLDAIRAGVWVDVMRDALAHVLQELIEREATRPSGPAATSGPTSGRPTATGTAPGSCGPRPATSSCTSRSSARARSCRSCSSPGGGSTGPLGGRHGGLRPRRVDPHGRRPGGRPGHRRRDQQERGVAHLRRARHGRRRLPRAPPRPCPLPVPLPRRDLREGPRRSVGRQQGHRHRHRGDRARATARCSGWRSATARTAPSGRPSCARSGRAAWPACGWSSATPTRVSRRAIAAVFVGAAWQRSSVHSGRGTAGPRLAPSGERLGSGDRLEILRQTRASAREASLHRPEGDVP